MYQTEFENIVSELTKPINDQYPRPWLTDMTNPLEAKVFIVGKNQAKEFSVDQVGSQEGFMNALFNRNGQTCRGLYDRITGGIPSQTRQNIDKLSKRLKEKGIRGILETDVICYSTPMSCDLDNPIHDGGRQRGEEIFQNLVSSIKPSVLIIHGAGTKTTFEKIYEIKLPDCPKSVEQIRMSEVALLDYKPKVIVIPSLAPPAYNLWKKEEDEYLNKIVYEVTQITK